MKKNRIASLKPNENDSSPLYLQLARKLAEAIRAGRFQSDEALPSERLLSESLGLSRVTARKAIDQLVEQGLIVRRRGSGNYIAPRIEQPLSRLSSFSEELRQRGHIPNSTWLKRAITEGAPEELHHLKLAGGSKVARLQRLRLADDVVMAYEVTVIPAARLPHPEKVEGSLYEHLADIGCAPVRAIQHLRAMNADPQLAAQLRVAVGQAVLFITRIGFLDNGDAVELTHSYCRSDYYDFVVELRRDSQANA